MTSTQQQASDHFAERTTKGSIGRYVAGFGIALGLTSLLNALLVVLKETYETTVLAALTWLTGNHWVSQGVIVLAVFLVLGLVLGRAGQRWTTSPGVVLTCLLGGPLISAAAIALFFLK